MTVYYSDDTVTLHLGDALAVAREMPSGSVDCVVTSPPYYGLRDYGVPGQYGAEASASDYVEKMRELFVEVRRVLADDGTLWLNLGDSYSAGGQGGNRGGNLTGGTHLDMVPRPTRAAELAPKNLMGIPWRVALALQSSGWILRNAVVWHKNNAMPESVTDRLSSRYEMVFMLTKQQRYWFDLDAIRQPYTGERDISQRSRTGRTTKPNSVATPWGVQTNMVADGARHGAAHTAGRNPGDVWEQPTQPFAEAHFAVMSLGIAERCIQAGCPPRRCRICRQPPTRNRSRADDHPPDWTDCGHDDYRIGVVLDPFSGSGTTGLAAHRHGRAYTGIDLNSDYLDLSLRTRLRQGVLDLGAAREPS
ncbi:DNA-methyltransferase [Nocardia altamirensis]|uniref:DNA-methyltransferase n=1 Tax=Nocardia altamirensis TaxID=472158 RepID=UPI00083FFE21|nr:site-specific DNA-methyltransferase [Nocardia altamirensis]